jgi:hypothetical protein
MREHMDYPCQRLLQEWQLRRLMVDSYHRSLRLLPPNAAAGPDSPGAPQRYRELRRELNGQLATALLALRQASNHLRHCEEEHALTH